MALLLFDGFMLWRGKGIVGERKVASRLSNGDENPIEISLQSFYTFPILVEIFDELPKQFQARDFYLSLNLAAKAVQNVQYSVRPTKRGAYTFGALNMLVSAPIGLFKKRFQFDCDVDVAVYPSYLQFKRYEFLAFSNRLTEIGVKKIRRIGQATNFDHIRNYATGDDPRYVNWKATARKSDLMVNQYEDEKAQNVVAILDLGRGMKMPFKEMTLLDYAVNATLVLSHIALIKEDKAGVLTFSNGVKASVKPDRKKVQAGKIIETLYKIETGFPESDYETLIGHTRRMLPNRSLLLFFTNFESMVSLQRQIPYLQLLAKRHLLVVIFFENTEIKSLINNPAKSTEEIYIQTIAEKAAFEKREIVQALKQLGIQSILTAPEDLTVNTLNKYLELKARGFI